jgi:putative FmdB family regulatory protein
MPIYGYRCRSCGHEFEILQRISDPALKTCPKCSGELNKLVYAAGVIFKGSGYYSTDYKSAATKSAEKADSNGSGGGSESSGDAKPAAEPKAESKSPKPDSST